MSFDLFLERLEAGNSAPSDRTAVLKILRRYCQQSGDRFGFYNVEFPDGSHVEFSAKNLESEGEFTGCAFNLRGFTAAIVTFVFEVAVAGDMVIFNAQGRDTAESPLAILIGESQMAHVPREAAANPALCSAPVHLAQLLGVGFDHWSEFRDFALGKSSA